MDLAHKYDVHRVIPHESRDDISIARLEVNRKQEIDFTNVLDGKTFTYPAT